MSSDEESKATSIIKQANWPVGQKFCAFSLPACLVTQQEVDDNILLKYARSQSFWTMVPGFANCINKESYKEDLQTHLVNVKQIDLEWLFANKKSFLEISKVLTDAGRTDLLMTDYVQIMLNVYWTENKWKIFWRIFVPYFLYLSITIFFMFNFSLMEDEKQKNHKIFFAFLNFISLSYQLYIEAI